MNAGPFRRWRRWLLAAAAGLALLPLICGCTSTVTPPTDPPSPTTVFVLREAMHTGLVFPPTPGSTEYVEFGYGDWAWFALGRDAWYNGFATVLWPTQGALGRRTFFATGEADLEARVYWADLSPLAVSSARAIALRTRLQQEHDAAHANAVTRPDLGWTFVPYDRSYWFAQNCADIAAEWCRELDCSVTWVPIRTGLAVAK